MLRRLTIDHVGPADHLEADFGSRLNILTGDNSLGKSFLLDVVYWCLTGGWARGQFALPVEINGVQPKISFLRDGRKKELKYQFVREFQRWQKPLVNSAEASIGPGVVLFAGAEQSVSVCHTPASVDPTAPVATWGFDFAQDFSGEEVRDGKPLNGKPVCNGLIADWHLWQNSRAGSQENIRFAELERCVLAVCDPDDQIRIDEPRRVYLDDSRSFPTLRLRSGIAPFPLWSSSLKRILGVCYLLVWAWQEYIESCRLKGLPQSGDIVLLVDEIETHLHPTWQRRILPALLEVVKALAPEANVQLFVTTHSPLVLASLEPLFDPEQDRLFHFEQTDHGVEFNMLPWVKHGDTEAWLTSAVFDLPEARSIDAQDAIKEAGLFLIGDRKDRKHQVGIDRKLRALLRPDDPFWDRWVPPKPVKK